MEMMVTIAIVLRMRLKAAWRVCIPTTLKTDSSTPTQTSLTVRTVRDTTPLAALRYRRRRRPTTLTEVFVRIIFPPQTKTETVTTMTTTKMTTTKTVRAITRRTT